MAGTSARTPEGSIVKRCSRCKCPISQRKYKYCGECEKIHRMREWDVVETITERIKTQPRKSVAKGLTNPPLVNIIKESPPTPAVGKPASPRQTPVFAVTSPFLKPRKYKPAPLALLTEARFAHLYKCPQRTCEYSTDTRKVFEMHLKQHVQYISRMQIPCCYCDFKTSFNLIGEHFDKRHSQCLFCCAYCFYRAINQSYVENHQVIEHPTNIRRVIIVSQNQDTLVSPANIAIPPMRSILKPYRCGQLGCEEKFIFASDFKQHLVIVHQGIPLLCVCCPHSSENVEAAVDHAEYIHNIYFYNCRYCVYGARNIDDIHKHLYQMHCALPPQIVSRLYLDKGTGKRSSDFHFKDDNIFNHVLVQTHENLTYITPSAKVYYSTDTTVSTKKKAPIPPPKKFKATARKSTTKPS